MSATAADVIAGRAKWGLFRGDATKLLASLPDGCVDHVVTDPPYSEHVHSKQRRIIRGGGSVVDAPLGFDALTDEVRAAVARHLGRLTKRWCLVFSDQESQHLWRRELEAASLRHVRCGAWVKLAGQPQLSGDRPAVGHEAIELAHGPVKLRWNGRDGKRGCPAVWHVPVERKERVHPAQKPLELLEALIKEFTDEGDLVLDPFAGAATTGVACLRLGRRYLGLELSETHFQAGQARLVALEPNAAVRRPYGKPRVVTTEPAEPLVEHHSMIAEWKRARILALHREGLSDAVIAERLGISRNRVAIWLVRLGARQVRVCQCLRRLRGRENLCYVCRGYRVSRQRDAHVVGARP